ncbi:MAG: hypothetical protein GY906_12250 [bacterium]|nr:hypothetical protein [bacterium]
MITITTTLTTTNTVGSVEETKTYSSSVTLPADATNIMVEWAMEAAWKATVAQISTVTFTGIDYGYTADVSL